MPRPRVSIAILTWNSSDVVQDAVRSCQTQTLESVETLVVDNGSTDGTLRELAAECEDDVRLVALDKNYGYTGGYNRALHMARGEFVLVLNPDARLEPDYLEKALAAFQDERVGIVAGLLVREGGDTLDSSGQFLARSRATIDRGYGQPFQSERDRAGAVLSACGAAALYRRAMIEDISDGPNFFDEDYFAFHEDLEVGWRAWRAGWKAVHVPEARATHLRSSGEQTGGLGLTLRRPAWLVAHIVKNRWLSSLRHDRARSLLWNLPFVLARDLKVLGALTVLKPSALGKLIGHRASFSRAWRKRRADRSREGVWGRWRRDVPRRGVWR